MSDSFSCNSVLVIKFTNQNIPITKLVAILQSYTYNYILIYYVGQKLSETYYNYNALNKK